MRKLYEVTHKGKEKSTLLVVAEDIKRVTEVYDPQKIELISDKVITVRDREPNPYDGKEMVMFKEIISYLRTWGNPTELKRDQSPLEYIQILTRHITSVECSNRGHQSTFSGMQEEIKKLKWILQNAVDTEEKHYESEETKAGWIVEAREILS